MVIDGIKVTTQPCVFLAINSPPPQLLTPWHSQGPGCPVSRLCAPIISMPSSLWRAGAGKMRRAQTQLETRFFKKKKNTVHTNKSEKKAPLKS